MVQPELEKYRKMVLTDPNVYVIGPPGPPEGPMDITGIHKNGCKIAWKPSKDDGGCPIEGYIVEKFDVDNGIWSPVGTSPTCDITCNDLEPGKEYEFRVRAFNSEGESDNLKSLRPIIAKDPFTVPLPPSAPEVVDWSENHMDLEWKEPIDDGGSPITATPPQLQESLEIKNIKGKKFAGER